MACAAIASAERPSRVLSVERVRAMFMTPFANVQDAVDAALAQQGPEAKVLFLTEASITVPRPRSAG